MTVTVSVDTVRCFGYGRCVDMVPEVFSLGIDGKSVARSAADVDRHLLDLAAWSCPMQAITVEGCEDVSATIVDVNVSEGGL